MVAVSDSIDMPPDAPAPDELYAHLMNILDDYSLSPADVMGVMSFTQELKSIPTPQTTYFVLGSYLAPYRYRLRSVADRLNRHLFTYAFLMGDHAEVTRTGRAETHVKFHLLARYADYIVLVIEHARGGQVGELNDLTYPPYFPKSHVLPRIYRADLVPEIDGKSDLVAVARLLLNAGLETDDAENELETLVPDSVIQEMDVELADVVAEAEQANRVAEYHIGAFSQVQHGKYDLFEDEDRVYPWMTELDLYDVVSELPADDLPP